MSLVGLGKAFELTFIRDGKSTQETVSFPGYWWAWQGPAAAGSILLVKVLDAATTAPMARTVSVHDTFHGEAPRKVVTVEAPTITGARRAGLVVSFAYDARGFSSSKGDRPYRHFFGAETHDDQPPFPESDLPALVYTLDGGIAIKRRPGNSFRLADWVIG